MAEHLFLCGLTSAQRAGYKGGTRLQIGQRDSNVTLKIEEIRKKYLTAVPDLLTDLLEIAAYVFAADNSVTRGGPAFRNMGSDWRRPFRLVIGVRELERWSAPDMLHALRELLGFLSDDAWQFEFVKLSAPTPWRDHFDFNNGNEEPGASNIVLFSGGLDSLAGAIQELRQGNQRIVLVSHKSSPIAINRQSALVKELRDRFGRRVFHVPVRVNMTNDQAAVEDTQRTRSFLFTAIATVVANLEGAHRIRFYENGIMSVNLPISAQVVGTRATRTTHPHSLKLLERFVRLIQHTEIVVDNPFIWKTKAEVVQMLGSPSDRPLIAQSISCSRTREVTKMHWHCGSCAQCLQRRIGTLGAGLEEADPEEGYMIDFLTGTRDDGEHRQMAVDMVRSALEFRRMSELEYLHRFAGEFGRLNVAYPGATALEAARNFVDLFKRHGETVRTIFVEAVRTQAEALVDKSLPPNCLLRLVNDSPEWRLDNTPLLSPPVDIPPAETRGLKPDYRRTSEIRMADDRENKCIRIDGLTTIRGATAYRLLAFLIKRFEQDQSDKKRPEHYQVSHPDELSSLLNLEDSGAVRSMLRRMRKKLSTEFEKKYGLTLSKDAVVENVHGKGYRLNPDVRILDVRNIKPSS